MSQIILASGSPRRKELLEQMGLQFEICPAKGEETITTNVPQDVVVELSKQKAREVAAGLLGWIGRGCPFPENGENKAEQPCRPKDVICEADDIMVIGADTVVSYQNQILGKPKDEGDAAKMLSLLSGRTHEVYTGVTIVFIDRTGRTGEYSFFEKTKVTMYDISEREIARYIATGEPLDKAGAYGIQGRGAIYIKQIDGDYYNVVGLPVGKLYQKLLGLGIDVYLW